MPMPGGEWPGTGAILAAVETASGRVAEIGGKPERHLFEMARERLIGRAPSGWRWSATASPPTSRAAAGPGWRRSWSCSGTSTRERGGGRRAAARPRRRRPRRAAAVSADGRARRPGRTGPALAFAGLFAVTFCGLLAVGAVLPVLPRYVHGPLGAGDVAVGVVIGSYAITGLLLRPFAGRLADRRGRKPTVLLGVAAARRRRLPLPAAARGRRPDRRPPRARRRRGHRLHRRLGLDRRPGAAGAPRPGDRPLRARGLGRAQRRAAGRGAAAARRRLHGGLDLRRRRCRCSGR